jgi:hypothetical protein
MLQILVIGVMTKAWRDIGVIPMGEIGFFLFAFVIEGDFGQEHIGADSGGGHEAEFFINPSFESATMVLGLSMIKIEVRAEIEEAFIDRIDVEVFFGHKIEEDRNHAADIWR